MKVSKVVLSRASLLLAFGLAACAGGGSSPNAQKLHVAGLDTFKFDVTTLTATAGQPVEVTLENRGQLEHSFVIDQLGVIIGPVAGGQSKAQTFTPGAAGSYTFYCAVPAHKDAGMTGTLTVNP